MAAAIRAHDWASTPLGPLETWPGVLRTTVSMILGSEFPMCIVWGEDLVTIYNDAFVPILGAKQDVLGKSFRDVWSEVWDVIGPIAERAFAGKATFVEDFPLTVERHGYPEQTYFTFCYSPIRDKTGRVLAVLDTVVETTAKVHAEQSAQLLNQELAHRLQNTLALVTAIVEQTFRSAASREEMRTGLIQRIHALGRAHHVLMRSRWGNAKLRAVIEGALRPHTPGRISLEGPDVELPAQHSLTLALAINELATNAARHGALSVDGGCVAIRWEAGETGTDAAFKLTWVEQGGPAVSEPKRRGFGSRLVGEVLAGQFRGTSRHIFDPAGVRFELATRMKDIPRRT